MGAPRPGPRSRVSAWRGRWPGGLGFWGEGGRKWAWLRRGRTGLDGRGRGRGGLCVFPVRGTSLPLGSPSRPRTPTAQGAEVPCAPQIAWRRRAKTWRRRCCRPRRAARRPRRRARAPPPRAPAPGAPAGTRRSDTRGAGAARGCSPHNRAAQGGDAAHGAPAPRAPRAPPRAPRARAPSNALPPSPRRPPHPCNKVHRARRARQRRARRPAALPAPALPARPRLGPRARARATPRGQRPLRRRPPARDAARPNRGAPCAAAAGAPNSLCQGRRTAGGWVAAGSTAC
jgi:hypothetical protein